VNETPTPAEPTAPLLRIEGVSKGFPGVQALAEVSLDVRAGEVHALVGENGAGKSTLMKILSGVYAPDGGRISIDDRPAHIGSPLQAQHAGIAIIYQEFNLMPNLSVAANIYVGREPTRLGMIDERRMHREARAILASLEQGLDTHTQVADLSVALQQMVEIAKALSLKARVLIMDEPTAALNERETEVLLRVIRRLRAQGLGVVFISHRLDEVLAVADRVSVLRDGRLVDTLPAAEVTKAGLIGRMVGRPLAEFYPHEGAARGAPVLEVRHVDHVVARQGAAPLRLRDISFVLHRGEVLGLAGLVGAGRTELARLLFGADPTTRGEILLDGKRARIASPADAIQLGIGLVPEDRKQQGLVLDLSVRENMTLPGLRRLSRGGFVSRARERVQVRRFVEALRIKTTGGEQPVVNLSGGNQQKVILARWLALQPRVLILDEPTRGIDVGAKAEIHALIGELAAGGAGVLVISSELPEVLNLADRVLVMWQGRVTGEFNRAEATQERIMAAATGEENGAGAA